MRCCFTLACGLCLAVAMQAVAQDKMTVDEAAKLIAQPQAMRQQAGRAAAVDAFKGLGSEEAQRALQLR